MLYVVFCLLTSTSDTVDGMHLKVDMQAGTVCTIYVLIQHPKGPSILSKKKPVSKSMWRNQMS